MAEIRVGSGARSPLDFISSALKASTVPDIEAILSRLPITPEDEVHS